MHDLRRRMTLAAAKPGQHLFRLGTWRAGSAVLGLCLVLWPKLAGAITPSLGYSGRLFQASGDPATGSHDLVFRIFDEATDGTQLFEEGFTGPDAITVVDGYFYVLLANNESGTMSLDEIAALYDSVFLELTVDGGLLEPRQPTAPVPWALVSGLASGGGTGGSGGDRDTLASLDCNDGQLPKQVGGVWSCGDDTAAGVTSCGSVGDVLKWDGSGWGCGPDSTGAGGVVSWLDIPDEPPGLVDVGGAPATVCSDGQVVSWNGAWVCINPPSGSDPRIGSQSAGGWCVSDGTTISCTQSAPLTAEADPRVGSTISGYACLGNGTQVDCSTPNPIGTRNANAWCTTDAAGVIQCTSGNPDTDTDTDTRCDTVPCGWMTAVGLGYTFPHPHFVSISEDRFRGRTGTTVAVECCTGFGGAYITSGGDATLVASFNIPQPGRITNITVRYEDVSFPYNLRFYVYVHDVGYFLISGVPGQFFDTWGEPGITSISIPMDFFTDGSLELQLLAAIIDTAGNWSGPWPSWEIKVFGAVVSYETFEAP